MNEFGLPATSTIASSQQVLAQRSTVKWVYRSVYKLWISSPPNVVYVIRWDMCVRSMSIWSAITCLIYSLVCWSLMGPCEVVGPPRSARGDSTRTMSVGTNDDRRPTGRAARRRRPQGGRVPAGVLRADSRDTLQSRTVAGVAWPRVPSQRATDTASTGDVFTASTVRKINSAKCICCGSCERLTKTLLYCSVQFNEPGTR